MKKSFIVGNWKMHFTVGESSLFLNRLEEKLHPSRSLEVIIAPSTIALQPLSLQVNRRKLKLCCQNISGNDYGAYTGETSVSQIRAMVDYVIVGHSERRILYGETDKDIRAKVSAALRAGLKPIICIGETAESRREGETFDVIRDEISSALSDVSLESLPNVILAYEPVWAISSTKGSRLASPEKVSEVINFIHSYLSETYGEVSIPILYGGSVNPSNAAAYLSIPGINGLLVGNSSLIVSEFNDIIEIAKKKEYDDEY